MPRRLHPVLVTAFALLMAGCGGESTEAPPAAAAEPAPAATRSGEFGVAVCDDFLRRYAACIERAPAEAQGSMRTALETWRGTWKPLLANPLLRDVLVQSCTTAAGTVEGQLRGHGC